MTTDGTGPHCSHCGQDWGRLWTRHGGDPRTYGCKG